MADRLDVMAVRITHKGGIVVRVVMRPQPRGTVIGGARRHRGGVKGIDGIPVVCRDRDVQRRRRLSFRPDPEIGLAVATETGGSGTALRLRGGRLHYQHVAERRQGGRVEAFRRLIVAHTATEVIDHRKLLQAMGWMRRITRLGAAD